MVQASHSNTSNSLVSMTSDGYKEISSYTFEFMEMYANRFGMNFSVINGNEGTDYHPAYLKSKISELLDIYDRIIFVDADSYITPLCPDLFSLVNEECVGSVPGRADIYIGDEPYQKCIERFGNIIIKHPYITSCLIVCSK